MYIFLRIFFQNYIRIGAHVEKLCKLKKISFNYKKHRLEPLNAIILKLFFFFKYSCGK